MNYLKKTASALVLTLLIITSAFGQQSIQLKQQSNLVLSNYYVAQVLDSRTNSSGKAVQENNVSDGQTTLVLNSGVAHAVAVFIQKAVRYDKGTTPITLRINKLQIKERRYSGAPQLDLETVFAFYKDDALLTEFKGSATRTVRTSVSVDAEVMIRERLETALKNFDDWWGKHKDEARMDGSTRFEIVLEDAPTDESHLGYSYAQKLTWLYFKGPVPSGYQELAATYSGLSVRYASEIKEGQTTIRIIITPFFNPQKSWVKTGASDAVLVHEQKHYHIALIESCKLANELRSVRLTIDNFEKVVTDLNQQAVKRISDRQEQYDSETNHGIIKTQQEVWNRRIAIELREANCY